MSQLRAFLMLARPHFLLGGALLYAVGASTVDGVRWGDYLIGQAMVTAAQVTAHFVNEYADVEVDRHVVNRTWFSGGSGVLSEGRMAPVVARRAALASSSLAVVFAALVLVESPVAAALGLMALAVSWLYSLPPVRLLDTGWGEVATSLVVAVLVPLIGAFANGGSVGEPLVWAVAMLFCVHLAMMLAFELPDLDSDRAAGKTVLAVRIGRPSTAALIAAALAVSALLAALAVAAGAVATPLLLVPAAGAAFIAVGETRANHFGRLTSAAVATLVLSAASFVNLG